MDDQEFLNMVKVYVQEQTVDNLIQTFTAPPGRRPREMLTKVSEWRDHLTVDEQKLFNEVVEESVRATLFSLFAVVDGARVVDNGIAKFIIATQSFQGQRVPINDTEDTDLHGYFAPN
jgi:hypothetical protein